MSDENVGGLVAKWRHIASQLAIDPDHTDACVGQALQACAAELAAAIAASVGQYVTADMVSSAVLAYVKSRGIYEGEMPVEHEDMRAALEAALSAHGQPVVDAELMKRVLGAPYDGVTVGDFFVYADFSEHDTLGVVRAIVAAALGDTP